jgi:hypothetical protein
MRNKSLIVVSGFTQSKYASSIWKFFSSIDIHRMLLNRLGCLSFGQFKIRIFLLFSSDVTSSVICILSIGKRFQKLSLLLASIPATPCLNFHHCIKYYIWCVKHEFLDKAAVPGRTGYQNTETLMELNILIYWFNG